jgi:hypothetical protein
MDQQLKRTNIDLKLPPAKKQRDTKSSPSPTQNNKGASSQNGSPVVSQQPVNPMNNSIPAPTGVPVKGGMPLSQHQQQSHTFYMAALNNGIPQQLIHFLPPKALQINWLLYQAGNKQLTIQPGQQQQMQMMLNESLEHARRQVESGNMMQQFPQQQQPFPPQMSPQFNQQMSSPQLQQQFSSPQQFQQNMSPLSQQPNPSPQAQPIKQEPPSPIIKQEKEEPQESPKKKRKQKQKEDKKADTEKKTKRKTEEVAPQEEFKPTDLIPETLFKEEPFKEQVFKEDAFKEDAFKEDAFKEDAFKEDAFKEESFKEEARDLFSEPKEDLFASSQFNTEDMLLFSGSEYALKEEGNWDLDFDWDNNEFVQLDDDEDKKKKKEMIDESGKLCVVGL